MVTFNVIGDVIAHVLDKDRLPIGVNIELLRQLRDCLVAFDRRQRDFRFEYRGVIPAGSSRHDCLLILVPTTWLISGLKSTYTAVRFSGTTSDL